MKEIKLTQGKVALVDNEDYDSLMQWKWCACKSRNTYYAIRNVYKSGKKKEIISMHRQVMEAKKGELIDHRDRNGLNCQKDNLRICTSQQNAMNRVSQKDSKYKGVYFVIQRKKTKYGLWGKPIWRARIKSKGIETYVGSFDTEVETALAYNTKAQELFGEFAYLNVVPPARYYQSPMLISVI